MAPIATTNTPEAWSPDVTAFLPEDTLPDLLISAATTVVTTALEGDSPVARVPWVDDDDATFVAEGAEIPEGDPVLAEVTVRTGKVSQLVVLSREQYVQQQTSGLLATSVARAITRAANRALISQPAPTEAQEFAPAAGLALTPGVVAGGTVSTDLDALADAVAQVQENNGTPGLILVGPTAWSALRKIKTAEDHATTLLGAGTEDLAPRLLGIPVTVTPAVPAGKLLVLDPSATAGALGTLQIATSTERYFERDSVGIRATLRLGWGVQRANRLAVLTVA